MKEKPTIITGGKPIFPVYEEGGLDPRLLSKKARKQLLNLFQSFVPTNKTNRWWKKYQKRQKKYSTASRELRRLRGAKKRARGRHKFLLKYGTSDPINVNVVDEHSEMRRELLSLAIYSQRVPILHFGSSSETSGLNAKIAIKPGSLGLVAPPNLFPPLTRLEP